MLMYASICKSAGNLDKNVAMFIVSCFTGSLKGWWDNVLTNTQKVEVLDAIKQETATSQPTIDAVYTLIQTLISYFVGLSPQRHERSREL